MLAAETNTSFKAYLHHTLQYAFPNTEVFFTELKTALKPLDWFRVFFGKQLEVGSLHSLLVKTSKALALCVPSNEGEAQAQQHLLSFFDRASTLTGSLHKKGFRAMAQLGWDWWSGILGRTYEEQFNYFIKPLEDALSALGIAYPDPAPSHPAEVVAWVAQIAEHLQKTPYSRAVARELVRFTHSLLKQLPHRHQAADAEKVIGERLERALSLAAQKAHIQGEQDAEQMRLQQGWTDAAFIENITRLHRQNPADRRYQNMMESHPFFREAQLQHLQQQGAQTMSPLTKTATIRDRISFVTDTMSGFFLKETLALSTLALGSETEELTETPAAFYSQLRPGQIQNFSATIQSRMQQRPWYHKIWNWVWNFVTECIFGEKTAETRLLELAARSGSMQPTEFVTKLGSLAREQCLGVFVKTVLQNVWAQVQQEARNPASAAVPAPAVHPAAVGVSLEAALETAVPGYTEEGFVRTVWQDFYRRVRQLDWASLSTQPVLDAAGCQPVVAVFTAFKEQLGQRVPTSAYQNPVVHQKLLQSTQALIDLLNAVQGKSILGLLLRYQVKEGGMGGALVGGLAGAALATGPLGWFLGVAVGAVLGGGAQGFWQTLDKGSVKPSMVLYTDLSPVVEPLFDALAALGNNNPEAPALMARKQQFMEQFKCLMNGEPAPLFLAILMEVSTKVVTISAPNAQESAIKPVPFSMGTWLEFARALSEQVKKDPYRKEMAYEVLQLTKAVLQLIPRENVPSGAPVFSPLFEQLWTESLPPATTVVGTSMTLGQRLGCLRKAEEFQTFTNTVRLAEAALGSVEATPPANDHFAKAGNRVQALSVEAAFAHIPETDMLFVANSILKGWKEQDWILWSHNQFSWSGDLRILRNTARAYIEQSAGSRNGGALVQALGKLYQKEHLAQSVREIVDQSYYLLVEKAQAFRKNQLQGFARLKGQYNTVVTQYLEKQKEYDCLMKEAAGPEALLPADDLLRINVPAYKTTFEAIQQEAIGTCTKPVLLEHQNLGLQESNGLRELCTEVEAYNVRLEQVLVGAREYKRKKVALSQGGTEYREAVERFQKLTAQYKRLAELDPTGSVNKNLKYGRIIGNLATRLQTLVTTTPAIGGLDNPSRVLINFTDAGIAELNAKIEALHARSDALKNVLDTAWQQYLTDVEKVQKSMECYSKCADQDARARSQHLEFLAVEPGVTKNWLTKPIEAPWRKHVQFKRVSLMPIPLGAPVRDGLLAIRQITLDAPGALALQTEVENARLAMNSAQEAIAVDQKQILALEQRAVQLAKEYASHLERYRQAVAAYQAVDKRIAAAVKAHGNTDTLQYIATVEATNSQYKVGLLLKNAGTTLPTVASFALGALEISQANVNTLNQRSTGLSELISGLQGITKEREQVATGIENLPVLPSSASVVRANLKGIQETVWRGAANLLKNGYFGVSIVDAPAMRALEQQRADVQKREDALKAALNPLLQSSQQVDVSATGLGQSRAPVVALSAAVSAVENNGDTPASNKASCSAAANGGVMRRRNNNG